MKNTHFAFAFALVFGALLASGCNQTDEHGSTPTVGTNQQKVVSEKDHPQTKYGQQDFPAVPNAAQIDALARQDALRYTQAEECDIWRKWPVVFDYDGPLFEQSENTLKLMEALARASFVMRRIVQNKNAGPVQHYPHEKRIYTISPAAAPYVRSQVIQPDDTPEGEKFFRLCFGQLKYGGEAKQFIAIPELNPLGIRRGEDGTFTAYIIYELELTVPIRDWVEQIGRQLRPQHQGDVGSYDAYWDLAMQLNLHGGKRKMGVYLTYTDHGWALSQEASQ